MWEENAIRGGITALILLLIGGAISAYTLLNLDREARRLLAGDKYWYPTKKRGDDIHELQKIKRRIKVLYSTLLLISIAGGGFFSIKIARLVGWL